LRCGAFGVLPTIDKCRASSALGREWGVDNPSAKSVGGKLIEMPVLGVKYGSKELHLYHHPELLVPESIKLWEKEYRYSGAYYGAVPYIDRHPCAIEAMEIYENAKTVFEANNGK
jgi:hypothetical protein